jgi:hypothetical protein
MNQQEATRAVIVCGLRAGRNMKEIMSYGNINKSTVYGVERKFKKFITFGGSAETVLMEEREPSWPATSTSSSPGASAGTPPPPGAGDEHFQNKYERLVSKDALR